MEFRLRTTLNYIYIIGFFGLLAGTVSAFLFKSSAPTDTGHQAEEWSAWTVAQTQPYCFLIRRRNCSTDGCKKEEFKLCDDIKTSETVTYTDWSEWTVSSTQPRCFVSRHRNCTIAGCKKDEFKFCEEVAHWAEWSQLQCEIIEGVCFIARTRQCSERTSPDCFSQGIGQDVTVWGDSKTCPCREGGAHMQGQGEGTWQHWGRWRCHRHTDHCYIYRYRECSVPDNKNCPPDDSSQLKLWTDTCPCNSDSIIKTTSKPDHGTTGGGVWGGWTAWECHKVDIGCMMYRNRVCSTPQNDCTGSHYELHACANDNCNGTADKDTSQKNQTVTWNSWGAWECHPEQHPCVLYRFRDCSNGIDNNCKETGGLNYKIEMCNGQCNGSTTVPQNTASSPAASVSWASTLFTSTQNTDKTNTASFTSDNHTTTTDNLTTMAAAETSSSATITTKIDTTKTPLSPTTHVSASQILSTTHSQIIPQTVPSSILRPTPSPATQPMTSRNTTTQATNGNDTTIPPTSHPVPVYWLEWSKWECSGFGTVYLKSHTRGCSTHNVEDCKTQLGGDRYKIIESTDDTCPAKWLEWGEWICKMGNHGICNMTRTRDCTTGAVDECGSEFESKETKPCDDSVCPDKVKVQNLGQCRYYDNHACRDAGSSCTIIDSIFHPVCESNPKLASTGCPKECGCCEEEPDWLPWSQWICVKQPTGKCHMKRDRNCSSDGECKGMSKQMAACSDVFCAVTITATWSDWSSWKCHVEAGHECKIHRRRNCSTNSLSDCDGEHREKTDCTVKQCPAVPLWLEWSAWKCKLAPNHTCEMTRTRTCSTGSSDDCFGNSDNTTKCSDKVCPTTLYAASVQDCSWFDIRSGCHDYQTCAEFDLESAIDIICKERKIAAECPITCGCCDPSSTVTGTTVNTTSTQPVPISTSSSSVNLTTTSSSTSMNNNTSSNSTQSYTPTNNPTLNTTENNKSTTSTSSSTDSSTSSGPNVNTAPSTVTLSTVDHNLTTGVFTKDTTGTTQTTKDTTGTTQTTKDTTGTTQTTKDTTGTTQTTKDTTGITQTTKATTGTTQTTKDTTGTTQTTKDTTGTTQTTKDTTGITQTTKATTGTTQTTKDTTGTTQTTKDTTGTTQTTKDTTGTTQTTKDTTGTTQTTKDTTGTTQTTKATTGTTQTTKDTTGITQTTKDTTGTTQTTKATTGTTETTKPNTVMTQSTKATTITMPTNTSDTVTTNSTTSTTLTTPTSESTTVSPQSRMPFTVTTESSKPTTVTTLATKSSTATMSPSSSNTVKTLTTTPTIATTQSSTPATVTTQSTTPNTVATQYSTPTIVTTQSTTPATVTTQSTTPNTVTTQSTTPNTVIMHSTTNTIVTTHSTTPATVTTQSNPPTTATTHSTTPNTVIMHSTTPTTVTTQSSTPTTVTTHSTTPTIVTTQSTTPATVTTHSTTDIIVSTHSTTPTPVTTQTTKPTTVIATTIDATTQKQPVTVSARPVTCKVCAGPDFLCEKLYMDKLCEPPENYCINKLSNHKDGNRMVTRSCGTFDTCYRDWFLGSSDSDKCRKFDGNNIVTLNFDCTYCCVDDNCNLPIRPSDASLYKDV